MWLPGYCTSCRRIKNSVRVRPVDMVRKHFIGICRDCLDKENDR